jgi:hypothetical protein
MAKSSSKSATKKSSAKGTVTFYGKTEDGNKHVVGIGNLRVVLVPEGNAWFAQGLEIDYAAQGKTVEEAKANFEKGLTKTIDQHLKMFGTLDKVLKSAPPEVWSEYLYEPLGLQKFYSQVSTHPISQLPFFNQIEYMKAA